LLFERKDAMAVNVLLIGGGGRAHAVAWRLSQSPDIGTLYIAPGNTGTEWVGTNVDIPETDIGALLQFALQNKIGIAIPLSEQSLAAGIVDAFRDRNLPIFGPTRLAADIEASKVLGKRLMNLSGIPTPEWNIAQSYDEAMFWISRATFPVVIKCSGLAHGKGVSICKNFDEAERTLKRFMLDQVFGDAGKQVIIEQYVAGPEFSIHALCSRDNYILFPPAQDHKNIFDNGEGPMTGGMGAIAPLPWLSSDHLWYAKNYVALTLKKLQSEGRAFTGCLYPGFKKTPQGLFILEYNARFGDPEAQVFMRLLTTDLLAMILASVRGGLGGINVAWFSGYAVCVELVTEGYPNRPPQRNRLPISGIQDAERIPGVVVFHGNTAGTSSSTILTNQGRVLSVTAVGDTPQIAIETVYKAVRCIEFEGMHYRTDIGHSCLTS